MNPVPFAPPAVVLLLLAAGSAVAPAVAEEFCVVCSEPPAVYRCQPEAAGPGPSYQLLCLQTLARDGGHASCAVRRGVAPTACDGAIRTLAAGAVPPIGPPSGALGAPPPADSAAAAKKSDGSEPPATVAEAARRAKVNADAQFKKAGETLKETTAATGNALDRTWACLSSFFKRCGSD